MALKLYYHPLSSFCHKVLIALCENDAPFEPVLVDLGEEESRAAFLKIWPMGQFPVLVDEGRNHMVPESSIIIEYLNQHYPGKTKLLPEDADRARQTRMRDRFFDFHVHIHMQKIMGDRRRPDGGHDPIGVQDAKDRVLRAYALIEENLDRKTWAMGDDFTMADCAAAPALFYGSMGVPFGKHKNAAAYLERLKQRPSYARVLKEAEPYFSMLPKEN